MMNEPKELKEIHAIREKIYEETKNMTPAERVKYTNDRAKEVIKEFNLNLQYEKRNSELS